MPPFFSVVIPTRNRSSLARLAAGYVLSQDFADLELLLLDNSDTPDLRNADFKDLRCKVVASERVLSMRDNWERTLDIAAGEYILVLSDKDMLLSGALRRLAEAIHATDTDMITYRKAGFSDNETGSSFIQRCTGQTTERRAQFVLRAWFDEVRHFHDAPMTYNSAVRRDVLLELKRSNGRFFTGTSPDIGSGAVLMAKLKKYHLLDRPLVVSWYGNWSIGMASLRGTQGAAAAFIAEYGTDPIRDAGLVTGIPGSVAETLLECKKQFPTLFASCRVRWSAYVASVMWDLFRKERAGLDTRADRQFLRVWRDKQYSWLARSLGIWRFHWERADLVRRMRTRAARLASMLARPTRKTTHDGPYYADSGERIGGSFEREMDAYFRVSLSGASSFRDVPSLMLPPSLDLESVLSIANEINCRLDKQFDGPR